MIGKMATLATTVLVALALGTGGVGATSGMRADLAGRPIRLLDVSRYHCHDVGASRIACFRTAGARDQDLRRRTLGTLATTGVYYVTWYEHSNYGGASFAASQSYSDLSSLGWNDAISSFKSLNGQRPKFWSDAGYGLPAWQWPAGAWVSYVSDPANDRFSSVQNVP
jgi:hypothetical protein